MPLLLRNYLKKLEFFRTFTAKKSSVPILNGRKLKQLNFKAKNLFSFF